VILQPSSPTLRLDLPLLIRKPLDLCINHSCMPRIQPLDPTTAPTDIKALFEQHIQDYYGSRITNMKATLGHSALAFEVYMMWYPLYHQVKDIVGDRMAYLFAHAISEGSDCPLCSTFFRKIIVDNGERPEALLLSENEQALLSLGSHMAQHRGLIPDAIYLQVAANYNPAQMVVLIAFAGQMIATNLFNNALEVEVDEYLFEYRKGLLADEGKTDPAL
jgi:hypothetical protein